MHAERTKKIRLRRHDEPPLDSLRAIIVAAITCTRGSEPRSAIPVSTGMKYRGVEYALITGLLVAALSFKLLERRFFLRAVVVFVAFAIPISLLFIPDLIGLRTRQFRFAYPSRIYSIGITVVIATLPILLNHDLFLWPSRVMDWFGRRPLRDQEPHTCQMY